jgi:alkylhydroperoxidase/carboxymuconolactone decarboxylase family protein YurZ
MDKNPSSATVKTPSSNFTGDVWLNPVFGGDGTSQLTCGLVRFTPGARTNWHSHANGQLLVCVDGIGLVGTRDGKTVVLRAGESVWTPADEVHFQRYLAANCFGDTVGRGGISLRVRELLTFSMLVALGGADGQVRGHVNGNLRVGNTRARLLAVLTVLVPFIGYPRTLNGLAALNEITGN